MIVDPEWWKNCFDDIYLLTDSRSVCDRDITRREVDVLCTLLKLRPGDRILDLCGGHGRHALELIRRGFAECTLVDYSRVLLAHAERTAREQGVRLSCVQADARDTGLPGASFDHVLIMGNSLGYGSDPDSDLRILGECGRLLRAGGDVLVDVVDGDVLRNSCAPNAWHEIGEDIIVCRQREIAHGRVNAREIVLSRRKGLLRDHTYSIGFYNSAQLEALLRRAGFRDAGVHTSFTFHGDAGDYGCMNNRMIGIGYSESGGP
jgi:D-alanine-D-alanine ligase